MTPPYSIAGQVTSRLHPERDGSWMVVDEQDKPVYYADSRRAAQRWIGSMTGVATRQAKAKKGKGEAA